MTPLDVKISRLTELKPVFEHWQKNISLEDLLGDQSAHAQSDELREYLRLLREVNDTIESSDTLVSSGPLSRQYIQSRINELEEELDEDRDHSLVDKLFYSEDSPGEIVRRLWSIQRLVVVYEVPADLKKLVAEARKCAALKLYNSVASLSRTIFETAVTDIALGTNKIPPLESGFQYYKNYPHHLRLGLLVPESSPDHKAMDAFYAEACSFVHGAKSASWSDAFRLLEKSLRFVEMLYARHRHSLPKVE